MRRKFIFSSLPLLGCLLCVASMAYALGSTSFLANILPNPTGTSDFIYQSIIAALTGAVLTGGSFFFLLRRIVVQFDTRHEKNEKELNLLEDKMHSIESVLTTKLYEQSEDLNREIRNNLTATTNLIIANLDSLREVIYDLVADMSSLKGEHNKCDYNSGDVKVIQTQIANLTQKIDRRKN